MALKPEVEWNYKRGNVNSPILFDNGLIQVYKNPANEIFVEDIRSGTTMRINSYSHLSGGLQFTTDGRVEPIQINGTIGWRIGRR